MKSFTGVLNLPVLKSKETLKNTRLETQRHGKVGYFASCTQRPLFNLKDLLLAGFSFVLS
jgi:hypothetical protein